MRKTILNKISLIACLMGMLATFFTTSPARAASQGNDSLGPILQIIKNLGSLFGIMDENLDIQGVWQCDGNRPGSGPFTVYQVYHAEGITTNYSSSFLYADGPYGKGFLNRSGLPGEYEKVDENVYRSKIKENVFRNYQDQPLATNEVYNPLFNNRGRLGATFYVDQTLYYDPETDTLCSGSACPAGSPSTTTKVKLLNLCSNSLTFNWAATEENPPPTCIPCSIGQACDNFNVSASITCKRVLDNFPDPLF